MTDWQYFLCVIFCVIFVKDYYKPYALKKIATLFFIIIVPFFACAQKVNQQIQVRVDNDKLVLVDRYYTSGIFIDYKKSIENNFLFKKDSTNKIQVTYAVGNEIYTPKNLSSFNPSDFDRPFAGWFFGKFEIGKITNKSANFLSFETGITGKEALSGDLQVWFHEVLGIENFTSWAEEIEFKWLFNIKYKYIHNWDLNKNNSFQYELAPSLGTKDIFLENSIHYFFGKFNELKNSSRLGVGTVYKNKMNVFKLIYNFNSKETPLSTSHSYGTFIYSRDF